MIGRAPFARPTFAAYRAAYREGRATPSAVVEGCLRAIGASDRADPPLRAVISTLAERARRDAEASDARWRMGDPRTPLDGIPVAIKDNIDVAGARTTNGTALEFPMATADARVVSALRDAGAIPVAKTNLHEIGAGTTGINPHHGTPRNPFDPTRWCGGSSSGSASAVGAGLVPAALGTDAGGSIRAPAAFVGAIGLKPTFGRVSRLGMSILCDTVDHIGPITATYSDAISLLSAIAGRHGDDEETWDQPSMEGYEEAEAAMTAPLAGLRVGVAENAFESPWLEAAIGSAVRGAAQMLEDAGAVLESLEVPDLEESRVAGLLILGSEGPSGLENYLEAHAGELGTDVQILLGMGGQISARDYLKAQRVRRRVRDQWAEAFERVDLVLMPATGIQAGTVHADALATGEIDERKSMAAITYTFPSNLSGFPAISVPCGAIDGLPVSAQIVGPPWQELRCARAAGAIEARADLSREPPERHFAAEILEPA